MQITLELPDDVAQGLETQVKNLPRALLESFAVLIGEAEILRRPLWAARLAA